MSDLSRRKFLGGATAALAGTAIAGLGLVGCSTGGEAEKKPAADAAADTPEVPVNSTTTVRPEGYICDEDWLGAAPQIADADIAETVSVDIVVVGGGHAGTQAALAAAQEGASVAVIEKHEDGEIIYRGDDICSYNSKLLEGWGFGPYNLEDIVNEYVRRAAGRCNSAAIRTFVYNSGEMMDNLVSLIPETSNLLDYEDVQCTIQVAYEKPKGADYPIVNCGYWQWASTLQTLNSINPNPVGKKKLENISRLAEIETYCRDAAEDLGAEWFCGQSALVCTHDSDGTVNGVIAEASDGSYVKYEAAKAVILATGDFGANTDMVFELCDECGELAERAGIPRENLRGMTDCDGSGHKIGCWAGGAIEAHPRPVAGSAPVIGFGPFGSAPCLWLNSQGKRFMNEECSSLLYPQSIRQPITDTGTKGNIAVMDKKYMQYIQKCGIDHGSPNWGFMEGMDKFEQAMQAEPVDGKIRVTTIVIASYNEAQNEMLSYDVYVGDTVEEALKNAGMSGDDLTTALENIEAYNAMCAAGVDSQYGKNPSMMIPVNEGPFYVGVQDTALNIGPGLNTLAGLVVSGNYEVLSMDRSQAIPGLYAVGNTMGERYGNSYSCPSAGSNMGNALTSGRVAGKHAAQNR